nr:hypothetical protein B0A51_04167 [Rachicladosporium sp. CCFEE 5018]
MSDPRTGRGTPAPSEAISGQRRSTGSHLADHSKSYFKVAAPDHFHGDRTALDDWLNQMESYFYFNDVDEDKKVLFATTFLRGRAQRWINPYLTGYHAGTLDDDDQKMFRYVVKFKIGLRTIFGISKEKAIAIRQFQSLRQSTSASDYSAKFQEHAQVTGWDDDALMVMYDRGLKNFAKDELMRVDKPAEGLIELIKRSITIDDKLYGRAMEKRNDFRPRTGNVYSTNFNSTRGHNNRNDRGDPMDLSATQKGRSFNNRPKTDPTGLTCYNCSKVGHIARSCCSPKKEGTVQRKQFNAVLPREKAFPLPRAARTNPSIPATNDRLHPTLGTNPSTFWELYLLPTIPTKRTTTPKTNRNHKTHPTHRVTRTAEDEDDWSENQPANIHFVAEADSPVQAIVTLLRVSHKHVFSMVGDGHKVHPNYLDLLLERIRAQIWSSDLVQVEYDFKPFVKEQPPIGSVFSPHGYMVPDGTFVNTTLRRYITDVKTRYNQCQDIQTMAHARVKNDTSTTIQIATILQFIRRQTLETRRPMPNGWEGHYEEEGAEALPKNQPWDHSIDLLPSKEPLWGPLYQQSGKELQSMDEWLKRMEGKGWIRKPRSPAEAPTIFVAKPNGKLRLVQDYRKLNDITIRNRYPLPSIEECQDRLIGANWFTKIDLRDAFYSIRMAEGEEWKTAFRTQYGLYEFLLMPMGLTNAPASCQALVNNVLRDLLDVTVFAYMDDILVFTRGPLQQHIRDVQAVFERLSTTSFKTAPEKCEFHKKSVKFLGFMIGTDGIKIDPEKTTSIREWQTPTCVKDIQSFLGLANYTGSSSRTTRKLHSQ